MKIRSQCQSLSGAARRDSPKSIRGSVQKCESDRHERAGTGMPKVSLVPRREECGAASLPVRLRPFSSFSATSTTTTTTTTTASSSFLLHFAPRAPTLSLPPPPRSLRRALIPPTAPHPLQGYSVTTVNTHTRDIPQLHPQHQSSSTSSIPCALSKQHSALLHCEASLDVTRSPPSSVCPALPCPALLCPVITIIIIIFIIFTHTPIAP